MLQKKSRYLQPLELAMINVHAAGQRTRSLLSPVCSVRVAQRHPTNVPIGANSPNGIGRATAHQYANNGAKAVYICDFSDSHLATHKREIESLYPNVDVHVRQFDAGDEKAVSGVIDEAVSKYGRLDIFFANAGIVGQPKLFTEIDGDGFMNTMKTNALG